MPEVSKETKKETPEVPKEQKEVKETPKSKGKSISLLEITLTPGALVSIKDAIEKKISEKWNEYEAANQISFDANKPETDSLKVYGEIIKLHNKLVEIKLQIEAINSGNQRENLETSAYNVIYSRSSARDTKRMLMTKTTFKEGVTPRVGQDVFKQLIADLDKALSEANDQLEIFNKTKKEHDDTIDETLLVLDELGIGLDKKAA